MALTWSDVGNFAENVLSGYGAEIQASGTDAQAKAQLNLATADLLKQKAASERSRTEALNSALKTAVIGVVAVMILWVFGKLILPRLLK